MAWHGMAWPGLALAGLVLFFFSLFPYFSSFLISRCCLFLSIHEDYMTLFLGSYPQLVHDRDLALSASALKGVFIQMGYQSINELIVQPESPSPRCSGDDIKSKLESIITKYTIPTPVAHPILSSKTSYPSNPISSSKTETTCIAALLTASISLPSISVKT